jgi:hypothetical protein
MEDCTKIFIEQNVSINDNVLIRRT